jgi:hypothetical protein
VLDMQDGTGLQEAMEWMVEQIKPREEGKA